MTTKRVVKVPVVVFERAKAAATTGVKKAPAPPPRPTTPGRRKPVLARDKVVAALKKLHPMD